MKGKKMKRWEQERKNQKKSDKLKKVVTWSAYVQEDEEEGQLLYIWRKNENE